MKIIMAFLIVSTLLLSLCSCEQSSNQTVPPVSKMQEDTALTPNRRSDNIDHNAFDVLQTSAEQKDTAFDAEILSAAEERKQMIRNTTANIEIRATAYYVSSDGDDSANGLSPETPWKSISKLNDTAFRSGDSVLFRRGDIWRGECLELKAGVTYSSYGDGRKPAIYGSPENGAGAEKWTLLEGTDNIWMFYRDILECGTIVLNDCTWTSKVNPYILNGRLLMPDASMHPFDIREALNTNLSFYCDDDTFLVYKNAFEGPRHPGKLYLRCDDGNPGDIYSSIEFCPWTNTTGGKGLLYVREPEEIGRITDPITVDNLMLKYTGGYGIYLCGTEITVQNCEIGWIGGCTTNYFNFDFFGGSGNCVGNFGDVDNYTVRNCYLYQAYDSGISSEQSPDGIGYQKNIVFEGNLIEDCLFGIEFYIGDDAVPPVTLEKVRVSDNYILNTGSGFGSQRQFRPWNIHDAALMFHPYYTDIQNVTVENNVFYKSGNYLILCGTEAKPFFSGNSYYQNDGGGLCLWGTGNGSRRGLDEYLFDQKAERVIREIIGDNAFSVLNK